MYKVGLIGCGRWGKRLLPYLESNPRIDSVKVSHYPDTNHEIIDDPSITHVFVATPVSAHFGVVEKCLLAGKEVMCEKPLTASEQSTNHLLAMAIAKRRQLMVDYIYSFNPDLPRVAPGEFKEMKIVMVQPHLNRPEDVMTVLGSHAMAIAGTITDIQDIRLINLFDYRGIKDPRRSLMAGFVLAGTDSRIAITISTETEPQERTLEIDGQRWDIDYPNGIPLMINRFLDGDRNYQLVADVAAVIQACKR